MLYDLIIIGAGAAGISSAIYAGCRRVKMLVLEQGEIGGLVNKISFLSHYEGIEIGKPGREFMLRAKKQLDEQHVEVLKEKVVSVDLTGKVKKIVTGKNTYETKTVIIAAGSVPNKVEFDGSNHLEGTHVFYEVDDETLQKIKGKEIFLIGGSDGAVKEAIYLSSFAAKVHIVCVEDDLVCVKEFKEWLQRLDNIEYHKHSSIVKAAVHGENLCVDVRDNKSNVVKQLCVENGAIFVFAGIKPASKIFDGMLTMENGFIKTDDEMKTNIQGVYAVGDIRVKKIRQVSLAVAEGTIAAINACNSLK